MPRQTETKSQLQAKLAQLQARLDELEAQALAQNQEPKSAQKTVPILEQTGVDHMLLTRDEIFRRTFDQSPIGAAMVDRDLAFVRTNTTLCRITGYSSEELLEHTVLSITHPFDQGTARALWTQLMSGAIDYFTMEQRYVRRDGETVWVNLSVQMLVDADGQRRLALPMMEDVSQRKRSDQEHQYSERKHRSIIEQSSDAIWLFDAQGRSMEWNPAAERLTGLSREQVVNRPIWEVLEVTHLAGKPAQIEPHVREQIALFFKELPAKHEFSMTVKHTGGSIRHVQASMFPIWGEDGLLVGTIARDITERIEAERQQIQLQLEQERLSMLTEFIGDASHEFRTPLSIINSNLYMLRRALTGQLELLAQVDSVAKQSRYVHSLLESMMAMTRIDSKSEWQFAPVPVAQLLDAMYARVIQLVEENGLMLTIHAPKEQALLECDEIELYHALTHILLNAIHFTPAPGSIDVSVDFAPDTITFVIADTGIGIPPEALPKIFDRFFRVDQARTTRGAGLGLAIARRIVKHHHGSIEVESREAEGSTFFVTLPRTQS